MKREPEFDLTSLGNRLIDESMIPELLKVANEKRDEGMKVLRKNLKEGRQQIAYSWGIYRYLENETGMRVNTCLLRATGFGEKGIQAYQNYGYHLFIKGMKEYMTKKREEIAIQLSQIRDKKREDL